jgi:hypothetical protein
MGPGERVKPQLFQVLIRGARPDSNSRPAVQISNPLADGKEDSATSLKYPLEFSDPTTSYLPQNAPT